jgi:predicted DNA-binding ribbon-helix-helix protein
VSSIVKRSLTIAGHRTSISLEAPFWEALQELSAQRGISPSALAAEIDSARQGTNLSSAIRIFILAEARAGALLAAPLKAGVGAEKSGQA